MLLFLDFDGVLHHFFPLPGVSEEVNGLFYYRPRFENAVRRASCPIEIVISSTWRNKKSLDEIKAMFSPDVAAMIIGATPKVGPGNGDGARHVEVTAWLEQNGRAGEHWVGIDDFPALYKPGDAVVACHDCFSQRETSLLLDAIMDPADFALRHPVKHASGPQLLDPPPVRNAP